MRDAPPVPAPSPGLPYRLGRTLFRLIFATYFRWRTFNPERVPQRGRVILASNHTSYLDPPLVGCALSRPLSSLARDTLFRFPIVGSVMRSWNAVPVDRDGGGAAGIRKILEALREERGIIIFPEGTRSRDGQLRPARSGVGLLVLKSDAPVVPVRIFGTFAAFGRHSRFPHPYPVSIKFGYPLYFEKLRAEARTCGKARLKEIYQEITDQIMGAIAALAPYTDKDQFP